MKGDDLWVVEIMAEGGENANRKGCFGRFSSLSCLVLQTATASAALNDAAKRCFYRITSCPCRRIRTKDTRTDFGDIGLTKASRLATYKGLL